MKTKHIKNAGWISLAAFVIIIGLSLILAYGINSQDPISTFFKKLYPVTFVGPRYISIFDSEQGSRIGQS